MGDKAKKIKKILEEYYYIIPRYQRNYAWGKAEISQLIKDIDEFFPKENNEKKSYYLGSLVCFKREDGTFELIDGQQRHTTLTLINLVLKNWEFKKEENEKSELSVINKTNLKYDSRKKVQNYIESLYQAEKGEFMKKIGESEIPGTDSYKDAIEIIQEELRKKNVQNFAKNFYENVYLFRVEVPEDTDLNHYFEIMNNRGEQLEKHEIVKALLMGKIIDENEEKKKQDQEKFSVIWDACADMNNYVYFNFEKKDRKILFGENGKLQYSISINKKENNNENKENTNTLAMIIANHKIPNDFPKEEKFIKDKYKSIIDFPNFLLQVLSIKYKIKDKDVSLDDKKLLEQFSAIKPEPKEFIFDLLKYRVLFDEYVIKQDLTNTDERKQNWGIRKLNSDFETTVKTFNDDEELVKLQVMLYYSDSTNTYNNWLQDILKYLGNEEINIVNYTEKVWEIAKVKFDQNKLSYPDITIFNLYFIDFLLWKFYAENIKKEENYEEDALLNSLKEKISNQKELFSSFKFRQLTSREHLFSQSQSILHFGEVKDSINNIGNLCLISTSQNSAGNKEDPKDKKIRFTINNHYDNSSLKRIIMFESYEGNRWGEEQIDKHKKEIEKLIETYISE